MRVAIAGAHGQIGMRLGRLLVERGDSVIGLIRNPDHADELAATGAEPRLCDLEHAPAGDVASAVAGADAVVFAAGAGPGSGAQRKLTMDRDGAVKLLAATSAERPRYVMISAMGAESPREGDDVFSVYVRAKAEADAALMADDRDWLVVRPGGLTNDAGTGRIRIASESFRGQIPRDDVAALVAAALHEPRLSRLVLYVNGGREPIADALAAAVSSRQ